MCKTSFSEGLMIVGSQPMWLSKMDTNWPFSCALASTISPVEMFKPN